MDEEKVGNQESDLLDELRAVRAQLREAEREIGVRDAWLADLVPTRSVRLYVAYPDHGQTAFRLHAEPKVSHGTRVRDIAEILGEERDLLLHLRWVNGHTIYFGGLRKERLASLPPLAFLRDEESNLEATFYEPGPPGTFPIFAVTTTGRRVRIDVREETTVLEIKQAVQEAGEGPVSEQRLIYGGRQLDYETCVGELGLVGGSALHVFIRLRGS